MYQLNYHSKASPHLDLKDLDAILEEATATNSIRDITGCLIYHNNFFVQILEGNKNDVLEVFEKIKTDKRHHSVTMLWESTVDKRYFSEWNMAYYRPEDDNNKQFVDNLILLTQLSERTTGALLSFWARVRKTLIDGIQPTHIELI